MNRFFLYTAAGDESFFLSRRHSVWSGGPDAGTGGGTPSASEKS
jgi:hypothetical protein